MKVCDAHPDRKAVDTIHCLNDDTRLDVCDECRQAVLRIFDKPHELGESPIAAPNSDASEKAPKRGLSLSGRK